MRRLVKLTPLLLSVTALSACSALNFGQNSLSHSAHGPHGAHGTYGANSGGYTQVASNTHTQTQSDYDINSGWYARQQPSSHGAVNPYAGGDVQLKPQPTQVYPTGQQNSVLTAHNGYHDAYGNPIPAPQQRGYPGQNRPQPVPALRGSFGPSYYGNIGGIAYDIDDDFYGIIGRLGVQKSWYGAEVEGSFGVSGEDDTVIVTDPNTGADVPVDVSADFDHTIAAFATARAPLGGGFTGLARLGYHSTQIGVDGSAQGFSANESEDFDGVAYGAGVEYDFDPVNGVRVDYTRYDLGSDTTDSLSATYLRRF